MRLTWAAVWFVSSLLVGVVAEVLILQWSACRDERALVGYEWQYTHPHCTLRHVVIEDWRGIMDALSEIWTEQIPEREDK